MTWAAAALCFFGFFRVGESQYHPAPRSTHRGTLAWGDVTVDNPASPQVIKAAVLAYMVTRGNTDGPFFKFEDGKPLTKARFTDVIREALEAVGLPQDQFAGHSFRIGAATTAVKAGIDDSTIRMLGRWNSTAFLVYIRTPREQLAQFSKTLAGSVDHPRDHSVSIPAIYIYILYIYERKKNKKQKTMRRRVKGYVMCTWGVCIYTM